MITPINNDHHLARLLGSSSDRLNDIADHAALLYRPFRKRKRNGKIRVIDRPIEPLDTIQKRIYRLLLRDYHFLPNVFGGVRGQTLLKCLLPHVGQPVVVTADLRDFYPSIMQARVYRVWIDELHCGRDVAQLLTRLTCKDGHLPQGASTSLALSNVIMAEADREILLRLSLLGSNLRYSRWVDDLVISGEIPNGNVIFDIVANAVRPLGLKIQRGREKRRIMKANQHQGALGHVLNVRVALPKPQRARIRASVDQFVNRRRGRASSVLGRVHYLATYHPELAARLLTLGSRSEPHATALDILTEEAKAESRLWQLRLTHRRFSRSRYA